MCAIDFFAFRAKIEIFFGFRFNTLNPFPESGSRQRFHASEMRAIDSPKKLPLYGSCLEKIFRSQKNFSGPKNQCTFFTHPVYRIIGTRYIYSRK